MDNKTTIRTFDSQTKYQGGGKLPYDDWYKTVPKEYNDTTHYNLRRAYDLLPFNQLENWRTNPNENHLSTVGYDSNSNSYEFLKRKDHPTIQYELDWYNSDDPEATKFRNDYSLDTTGNYYKYVPKKEQGGYIRTSKSGRKFTYPSIEQRKQEIINKITMKTTNKPDD